MKPWDYFHRLAVSGSGAGVTQESIILMILLADTAGFNTVFLSTYCIRVIRFGLLSYHPSLILA